ncbi:MAG: hypothetical protein WC955_06065 [Elusimicrobiota bacterium]
MAALILKPFMSSEHKIAKVEVDIVSLPPEQSLGQAIGVACQAVNTRKTEINIPITLSVFYTNEKEPVMLWSLRQDVKLKTNEAKTVVFNYLNTSDNNRIGQYTVRVEAWSGFKNNRYGKRLSYDEKKYLLREMVDQSTMSAVTEGGVTLYPSQEEAVKPENSNTNAGANPAGYNDLNAQAQMQLLQQPPKRDETVPVANAEVLIIYPEGSQVITKPMDIWCDLRNTGNTMYEFGVEVKVVYGKKLIKFIDDKVKLDVNQVCRFKYDYNFAQTDVTGKYTVVARVKKRIGEKVYVVDQERKDFMVVHSE